MAVGRRNGILTGVALSRALALADLRAPGVRLAQDDPP